MLGKGTGEMTMVLVYIFSLHKNVMNFVLCLPSDKNNVFVACLWIAFVPNSLSQDELTRPMTKMKLNALEIAILIASLIGWQRLIAL